MFQRVGHLLNCYMVELFEHRMPEELLVSVTPNEWVKYPFTNGNSGLTPENIDTVELDLMGQSGQDLKVRASTFASVLQNQINKRVLQEGVTSSFRESVL